MHQSSVTNYFKVKKRPREDSKGKKCSKVVAISHTNTVAPSSSTSSTAQVQATGTNRLNLPISKDSPVPIKANSDISSPEESPFQGSKLNPPEHLKSPAKAVPCPSLLLSPVPLEKFFSPIKQNENIFASPIKLSEIRSPSKVPPSPVLKKAAVKRLFDISSNGGGDGDDGEVKSKKIPAFQRLNYLAQKDVNDSGSDASPKINENSTAPVAEATSHSQLQLPHKYKLLLEVFRGVETVSTILFNRNETITFTKLKPAVQELIRSTSLKEKYLAQILTVFPESYKLSQEKMKDPMTRQYGYQLVLTPTFTTKGNEKSGTVSPLEITERKQIFQNSLLKICHEEHKKFLLKLKPPILIPDGKKVTRWHPKFKLDEIHDIPASLLPAVPDLGPSSAKDVISKAQAILQNANPKMKAALLELQKKSSGSCTSSVPAVDEGTKKHGEPNILPQTTAEKLASTKASLAKAQLLLLEKAKNNPKMTKALNDILIKNKKAIPIPDSKDKKEAQPDAKPEKKPHSGINQKSLTALKGISQSLIEKIRAREQEKSIQSLTLTPEQTKRRAMLGRLPDIVQIVRNTLVAEKKAALPIRLVLERVRHSLHGAISEVEVEQHLNILHELLPTWMSMLKCTQGVYIKIDKQADINLLLEQLREIIRKTK